MGLTPASASAGARVALSHEALTAPRPGAAGCCRADGDGSAWGQRGPEGAGGTAGAARCPLPRQAGARGAAGVGRAGAVRACRPELRRFPGAAHGGGSREGAALPGRQRQPQPRAVAGGGAGQGAGRGRGRRGASCPPWRSAGPRGARSAERGGRRRRRERSCPVRPCPALPCRRVPAGVSLLPRGLCAGDAAAPAPRPALRLLRARLAPLPTGNRGEGGAERRGAGQSSAAAPGRDAAGRPSLPGPRALPLTAEPAPGHRQRDADFPFFLFYSAVLEIPLSSFQGLRAGPV